MAAELTGLDPESIVLAALVRQRKERAVALPPGPEPELARHAQQCRDHSPASRHRKNWPAWQRPVFADRAAQRHGGARSAVFQTSCRPTAISATRNTTQKWRRFLGRALCLAKTGEAGGRPVPALKSGEIKAVWIACTNPAQSMPDVAEVRAALETAEFVVLQEAYGNTDTAQYADLLLPATSWGEKEGTVTNSERRISRVRAAVPPPARRATTGRSRSTSRAALVALSSGASAHRKKLFPYTTPESIHAEHRRSTRGRDLDITGLSYALLRKRRPAAVAVSRRWYP